MSKSISQPHRKSAYERARRKQLTGLYLFIVVLLAAAYSGLYLTKIKHYTNALAVCIVIPPCIVVFYLYHLIKAKIRDSYLGQSLYRVDKMTGEEFERFLYHHFVNKGYKVLKIGQSNDYGADLILTKGRSKTVVQAKRYKSKVGIKAVQEVIGAINYYHANRGVVVTNSRFSAQAMELAKEAGIELYDRDFVKQLIKK